MTNHFFKHKYYLCEIRTEQKLGERTQKNDEDDTVDTIRSEIIWGEII